MNNAINSQDNKRHSSNTRRVLIWMIVALSIILLLLLVVLAVLTEQEASMRLPTEEPTAIPTESTTVPTEPTEPTEPTTIPTETTLPTEPPITEPTVPEETEPTMLPELVSYYEENPDIAGWITIEDTVVDYPVMYTPDDEEKYLYRGFNGFFDVNGLPFIEDSCSLDPESDNIIIYGHKMSSGKMFASLLEYAEKSYWEEHPIIQFSTLYEHREYEIVAAFYDRVYYKYENCFKFYQFIDAEDEDDYNEAISYYKYKAEYDTGVTAQYGDRLITLVTCSYHHKYGRFVVVAREKLEEPQVSEEDIIP